MNFGPSVPRDMYDALLEKYDALVKEVLQLKKDGFSSPYRPVEPAEEEELFPVPDLVEGAIQELFHKDSIEAKGQREVATGLLRQGHSEEDVAAMILAGEDIGL